jgi:hypothetical protein
MNVADFIFRLLQINNLPTLSILTPLRLPYTPYADYAHLSHDYENIIGDCTDSYADSANMLDISSLDLYIPNPTLLQLLLICKSKIKIVFIVGFVIYSLSSSFFIYGFCISHSSSSSFVLEFTS